MQNPMDTALRVVLASIQTLAIPRRVPARVAQEFGQVWWDECHRVPAQTFMRSLAMFPARVRVGLTATPQRADKKHFVTEAHIGQVRVVGDMVPMKPKVSQFRTAYRIPRDRDGEQVPHGPKSGWLFKAMAGSQRRNELITALCVQAYQKGRHNVVFAAQRAHLDKLHLMAMAAGIPAADIGFYVGGLKGAAERDEAAGKRLVLATYHMADTGTDYQSWDACVLASPKAQVKQTIGRILRSKPGKPQPVIVDLVDADSPMFTAWAEKREAQYRQVKATFYRRWRK